MDKNIGSYLIYKPGGAEVCLYEKFWSSDAHRKISPFISSAHIQELPDANEVKM